MDAKGNGEWNRITFDSAIGNGLRLDFGPVKERNSGLTIRNVSDTPVVAEFQQFGT